MKAHLREVETNWAARGLELVEPGAESLGNREVQVAQQAHAQRPINVAPLAHIEPAPGGWRRRLSFVPGRLDWCAGRGGRVDLAAVAIIRPEHDPHDPIAVRVLEAVSRDSLRPKGGAREAAALARVERHASGIPSGLVERT
jgi:hypothetical protein